MWDGTPATDVLRAVNGEHDVRLLRRLDVREGETGVGGRIDTVIGVVVDCETTGIGDDDVIIEFALRRFRADPEGVIVKIDRAYSWLEDPGRDLPEDIVRLTGITDADVAGEVIDEEAAVRMLKSADFVCAHNARFDRAHVERRLPEAAGLAWTCSCNDVDWRAGGLDGRSPGWLLAQCGYFHGAHRAGDDVDAVIEILRHRFPTGTTALAEMLATARAPTWRFRAVGAAFEVTVATACVGRSISEIVDHPALRGRPWPIVSVEEPPLLGLGQTLVVETGSVAFRMPWMR